MAERRTVVVMCHGVVDTDSVWKGPLQANLTLNYATDPTKGDQILCASLQDVPIMCQMDAPRFRVLGNQMYYNLKLSFLPRAMPGRSNGVYTCQMEQIIDFETDPDFAGIPEVTLETMIAKILQYMNDMYPTMDNDNIATTIWVVTCSPTSPSRMKMHATREGFVDPLLPYAQPLYGYETDEAGLAAITEQRRQNCTIAGKRRRKTAIRKKNGRRRTQRKRKTYVRARNCH